MALALIDTETGETIRTVEMCEGDSVRLIHKVAQNREFDSLPFDTFIKLNGEEVKHLSVELSSAQLSFLLSLLPYMSYTDNCIKDGHGSPLSVTQIAERLDISRKTANRIINDLIEEDLLCKAKNSAEFQLFVNPWFAGKGNRCNRVLSTMFRNYKVRSMGGRRWKNLKKIE